MLQRLKRSDLASGLTRHLAAVFGWHTEVGVDQGHLGETERGRELGDAPQAKRPAPECHHLMHASS
jgi:hypothetical protein